MTQVKNISNHEESNIQSGSINSFETCEEIVDNLVEKGIPANFNPDTFISKVSKAYGINYQEARTCVKMAVKQLEKDNGTGSSNEILNGQTGYFWKTGYTTSSTFKSKNDGMDSLSSLGSYNKLIFGIK